MAQTRNTEQNIGKIREELEYREKLLNTVNLAAEVLLTSSEERTMDALMLGMEIVGRCVEADRVQIWRNEMINGELHFVMRYEWLSEIGKLKREVPIGLKFPYTRKPKWYKRFMRGNSINAPISKLPPEDGAFLGFYEMVSIVCLPLFINNEFIGFFSVDDCQYERYFTENEMDMFRSAGLMFTSVFNRMSQTASIAHRDRLLEAVNDAAGFLLNTHIESFDTAIFQAMGVIAAAVEVDRVFIWQNHKKDGKLHCTQRHEWSEGAEPLQGSAHTTNIAYSNLMSPQWQAQLEKGKPITGIVRDMPPETQMQFEPHGTLSIMLMPILMEGDFWGFIGFDDCHAERIFTDEEQAILKSCGLLFANAVTRNKMIRNIQKTSARLELALDQANLASKAKGDFLSNMSHEMRTPMNAIMGMTTIGLKTKDMDGKNRALDRINDAASHLLGVINDILDMAKIEADKMELMSSEYQFDKMLQRVLTLTRFQSDQKSQTLTVNVDKKMPSHVVGDEQRLAQAITNLLSNAIKFTKDGGTIRLDVSLHDELGGCCEIVVKVRDNGIGIPASQLDKLFNAFEQAEGGAAQKGTGLGLPITKRIIEMMGGRIWVESYLGKGTEFTFTVFAGRGAKSEVIPADATEKASETIPPDSVTKTSGTVVTDVIAKPQSAIATDATPKTSGTITIDTTAKSFEAMANIPEKTSKGVTETPSANTFNGKHMLIAEDLEVNREIITTLLEDSGLIIDCAKTGKEAFDMVAKDRDKYDIVFMDMQMPVMNGLEATRHIRTLNRKKRLPIIALTANIFKDDIEACLDAGMDDHLGKPFDMEKVYETLRKYLHSA